MQKVLTAEEMREVDRLTTEKYGIPSIILMENAAHATASIIKEKLGGSVKGKSFLILCGKGNNGGDGAALARILWMQGADVDLYLIGKTEDTKGDAKVNFKILKRINSLERTSQIDFWKEGFLNFVEKNEPLKLRRIIGRQEPDVFVDAIFGTGLTRPIEGELAELFKLNLLYEKEFYDDYLTVAVDLPSGLDADIAEPIGDHAYTDLTVTFTAPKLANVLPSASNFNGELHIANIGSPQELIDDCQSKTYLTEKQDVQDWLRETRFSSGSYKNKRGNAVLVVGSKNYTGAAVLAGNAAMASGIGLVTIATSESAQNSISTRVLPEVMTSGVAEAENGAVSEDAFEQIKFLSKKADVLAIGSGLSSDEETTRKLVRKVVENRKTPIVIDADGLNSLSPFEVKGSDELPLVLTPHEGEFLSLLGTDDKAAIKDRVGAVRDFAQEHQVILVLKGERTLIAEPSGEVVINPTGNSGLGKAGNGDNLTGIITGFIAQAVQAKVDIFETVVAAVYVAGLAGDIAAEKFGKRTMLASDVRECLNEAFAEIENG